MNLSFGNIYPIPEYPAEEERNDRHSCETSFSVSKKVIKKLSSSSLPEKQVSVQETNLTITNNHILTFMPKEENYQELETVKATHKNFNRLSVSLLDFSNSDLTKTSGIVKADKEKALSNMTLPHMISEKGSKSYRNIQDYCSYSNEEPEYEILLSPCDVNSDQHLNSATQNTCQSKQRKESNNLVFIDLNSEEDGYQTLGENSAVFGSSRQRAGSMQWIQSAFQNVSHKYKGILDFRRPSDIAEERMRKSKEGLNMEESESEATTDVNQNSSSGARRFSENITGKQKRFPFAARLGYLKVLWKDRNSGSKRQEEKENDQTRTDVCPLFTFPRKRDEDELILDTLRQAMRKCTTVDPISRPTSTVVFENLSNLLKDC